MLYYILYPFSCLIGWMPRFMKLGFAWIIKLFLYRLFGYRVKIVRENLLNSFPEMSDKERRKIETKFYTHLSDIFVENMGLLAINRRTMQRYMTFPSHKQFEEEARGRSVIAMMAHYGSWEYLGSYALHSEPESIWGVYRPLNNKGFDKFFLKFRIRLGMVPVTKYEVAQKLFAQRHSKRRVVVALVADQSPHRSETAPWFTFLNQPTQFHLGGELMATKMKLPAYYVRVERVKRGYYTAIFEQIFDGKEQLAENEVTERYIERLEAQIREQPELWMWTHRRWKHKPEDV